MISSFLLFINSVTVFLFLLIIIQHLIPVNILF
nr:MAG TPA: hypothetical protein [Caudoviricetes sp.]